MLKIIELQTDNGTTVHIVHNADTVDQAMSKYHEILMYAAVSELEKHACVVLADNGNTLVQECYEHQKIEQNIEPNDGIIEVE